MTLRGMRHRQERSDCISLADREALWMVGMAMGYRGVGDEERAGGRRGLASEEHRSCASDSGEQLDSC